jgi:hypothetical protein
MMNYDRRDIEELKKARNIDQEDPITYSEPMPALIRLFIVTTIIVAIMLVIAQ